MNACLITRFDATPVLHEGAILRLVLLAGLRRFSPAADVLHLRGQALHRMLHDAGPGRDRVESNDTHARIARLRIGKAADDEARCAEDLAYFEHVIDAEALPRLDAHVLRQIEIADHRRRIEGVDITDRS